MASGNYYQVLGVSARLGRVFVPDDDRPSAAPVAVISSRYWHSRFATDPAVVGKTIKINKVLVTIVGVEPADFSGVQSTTTEPADVTVPLSVDSLIDPPTGKQQPSLARDTYWWLQIVGRLKPGVTAAQVQGNLEGVFQSTARAGLASYLKGLSDAEKSTSDNSHRRAVPTLAVDSAAHGVYDANTRGMQSVTMLSIVVALMLLIVCANVANLLLSRAAGRQREMSVRLSLGATRPRLVRQLLTESLVLAAAGGALGILVGFFVQGRTYSPDPHQNTGNEINVMNISPKFFGVMQIPIVMGRALTDHDDASAPKVAVINEAAARRFFGTENPMGRHFGESVETTGDFEIVGLLHDTKYDSVRDPAPPTMYIPYRQARLGSAVFELRTANAPTSVVASVREAVRQVDPNLPVTDVSTQIEEIETRFAQEQLFAQAYALFGGLALLLASIGLFGLMSYSVSRRTNEIGIRMALGARREDVLRLVMRESMTLVVVGVVVGLAAAAVAVRFVVALLFDVAPRDAATLAAAIAVMSLVAAFASYLPARRASRVDPMVALRYE